MMETDDQSEPGEQDLVILLGLGEALVEIPLPESLGVESTANYLLVDDSYIAGNESQLAAQLESALNNEQVREKIRRGQQAYHAQYLNNLDGQVGTIISNYISQLATLGN
jgi:hypothetical protein